MARAKPTRDDDDDGGGPDRCLAMGDAIEPRAEAIQRLEGSLGAFGADVAPGRGNAQGSSQFREGNSGAVAPP